MAGEVERGWRAAGLRICATEATGPRLVWMAGEPVALLPDWLRGDYRECALARLALDLFAWGDSPPARRLAAQFRPARRRSGWPPAWAWAALTVAVLALVDALMPGHPLGRELAALGALHPLGAALGWLARYV